MKVVVSAMNKVEIIENSMRIQFAAKSENESFARMSVIGFIAYLNPTIEVLEDIKIAVSEAVTNAIIHGYQEKNDKEDIIEIRCEIVHDESVYIEVSDQGIGIEHIEQSLEPMYTSVPDTNRAGMGFSFMEAFMDGLEVESQMGIGTKVRMSKKIGNYGK